jgi:uncharacterized membrane protein
VTDSKRFVSDAFIDRSLPTLFAVIAIVVGPIYALTLPPCQAPDEFEHLFRAYGLSEGYLIGPPLTPIPASIISLIGRYPPHVETLRKLTRAELVDAMHERLNPDVVSQAPNEGMNVNAFIPYIPSAIAIFVARPLNISPLALLYVSRLANLVAYVALTWLALHLLQGGRAILYALGLMPMVLHQAASLSWDSIVFGIAFVFLAMIIRYTMNGSKLEIRQCAALLGMVVVVSLCKVNFALLPLLLLLPPGCFGSRKRQMVFWTVCGSAAILTIATWQYLNRVNLELFERSINALLHSNFPGNIWYLYYNTGYFLNALGRSIVITGFGHLTEFVGTFGWLFVSLPAWAVLVYVVVLLTMGLAGASGLRWSWFQRAILLGVVLLGSLGCVVAMWLATPTSYIQDVILHNIGTLYGIQGRHFIPFGFPALVLLANRYLRVPSIVLIACASTCIITVNVVALLAIRSAY